MDISQYRKDVEARLAEGSSQSPQDGDLLSHWLSRKPAIGDDAGNRPDEIDGLLDLVRNATAPHEERRAALRVLEAARFSATRFAPYKQDFLQAMRQIATDPDAELREDALTILIAEGDGFAQTLLVNSLEAGDEALVSDAEAIQLLAEATHGDHLPLIRSVLEQSSDEATIVEALLALAADPESEALFEAHLVDRTLGAEVRRASALALQTVNPQAFENAAREIVMNEAEDETLRATCLSALAYSADHAEIREDSEFATFVSGLAGGTTAGPLDKAARRFSRQGENKDA